jgi:hypothetical protein
MGVLVIAGLSACEDDQAGSPPPTTATATSARGRVENALPDPVRC